MFGLHPGNLIFFVSDDPADIGSVSPDHEHVKDQQCNEHGCGIGGQVDKDGYQQSGTDTGYSDDFPDVEDHQKAD